MSGRSGAIHLLAANEALANAVQRAGITEVWVAGKAATGDKLRPAEAIELALRMPRTLSPVAM